MIHKFIIELTDEVKGYDANVEYLERIYGAEEVTDIPIIHGKEELKEHDTMIYNKAIDHFVNECIRYEHLTFEQEHIERIQEIAKQLKVSDK